MDLSFKRRDVRDAPAARPFVDGIDEVGLDGLQLRLSQRPLGLERFEPPQCSSGEILDPFGLLAEESPRLSPPDFRDCEDLGLGETRLGSWLGEGWGRLGEGKASPAKASS